MIITLTDDSVSSRSNISSSSSQESLGGMGPMASSWGGAGGAGARAGAASAASIASMHQQKKRGIKSSLGRFFSKKEKAGMPVGSRILKKLILDQYNIMSSKADPLYLTNKLKTSKNYWWFM